MSSNHSHSGPRVAPDQIELGTECLRALSKRVYRIRENGHVDYDSTDGIIISAADFGEESNDAAIKIIEEDRRDRAKRQRRLNDAEDDVVIAPAVGQNGLKAVERLMHLVRPSETSAQDLIGIKEAKGSLEGALRELSTMLSVVQRISNNQLLEMKSGTMVTQIGAARDGALPGSSLDAKAAVAGKSVALRTAVDLFRDRKKELQRCVDIDKVRIVVLMRLQDEIGGSGNLDYVRFNKGAIVPCVSVDGKTISRILFKDVRPIPEIIPALSYNIHRNKDAENDRAGEMEHIPSMAYQGVDLNHAEIFLDDSVTRNCYSDISVRSADEVRNVSGSGRKADEFSTSVWWRPDSWCCLRESGRSVLDLVKIVRACRMGQFCRDSFHSMLQEAASMMLDDTAEQKLSVTVLDVKSREIALSFQDAKGSLVLELVDRWSVPPAKVLNNLERKPVAPQGEGFLRLVCLCAFVYAKRWEADKVLSATRALNVVCEVARQSETFRSLYDELISLGRAMNVRVQWVRLSSPTTIYSGLYPHDYLSARFYATNSDGDGQSLFLGSCFASLPKCGSSSANRFATQETNPSIQSWFSFMPAISCIIPVSWRRASCSFRRAYHELLANDAPRSVELFANVSLGSCEPNDPSENATMPIRGELMLPSSCSQLPTVLSLLLCNRLLDELEYVARHLIGSPLDVDRQAFSLQVCTVAQRSLLAKIRPDDRSGRPQLVIYVARKSIVEEETPKEIVMTSRSDQIESRLFQWVTLLRSLASFTTEEVSHLNYRLYPPGLHGA